MVIFKILLILFIIIVLIYSFFSITYSEYLATYDYGPSVLCGGLGVGKSTLLAKFLYKYKNKGWKIFSNFDMAFASRVKTTDYFKYSYPRNSLILMDEAQAAYDGRNFKNFSKEHMEWLVDIRKQGIKVIYVSQGNSIDKRIRDLSDVYIVKKFWLFTIGRRVGSSMDITTNKDDKGRTTAEGDIVYKYFYRPITDWVIAFIPRWSGLFDTWQRVSNLPIIEYKPFEGDEEKLTSKWYRDQKINRLKNKWIIKPFVKVVSVSKSFIKFFKNFKTSRK